MNKLFRLKDIFPIGNLLFVNDEKNLPKEGIVWEWLQTFMVLDDEDGHNQLIWLYLFRRIS